MNEAVKPLILAIPVEAMPNHDKTAKYSVWEKVQCIRGCGRLLWFGVRSKTKIERGEAEGPVCPYCWIKLGGTREDVDRMQVLTQQDKEA